MYFANSFSKRRSLLENDSSSDSYTLFHRRDLSKESLSPSRNHRLPNLGMSMWSCKHIHILGQVLRLASKSDAMFSCHAETLHRPSGQR